MALVLNELLSWRGALDVVIIGAGIFFLYRTLVRLGTWKILVGIVAAFIIFIFARLLQLQGVEWIYMNVSQVAVLALIVIFQPELRKIFEKVVSLYSRDGVSTNVTFLETVAESLWKLAKLKQGALVVYPGKEPIAERISGGHRLVAEASVPLIMSIFDPNSPGHDGALIVENNKLISFGVRLPMSQSSRLAEEYGTRHHAAMGMAEMTDSLILVVSEERGAVSAFRDSSMTGLGSVEEIVAQITNHQSRHGIFDIKQLGLIDRRTFIQLAASLALAAVFLFGLTSANKQIIEQAFTLPVVYGPPSEGLFLVGDRVEEVRVHIAGPKSVVEGFLLAQPAVKIDLSSMVEGTQTILISGEHLDNKKISVQGSSPSQLEVTLARIIKRAVPVVPQLVGKLPAGLRLKRVTVMPEEVQVMAPLDSQANKPFSVSTTPVYLNSIQSTSRIFCKIIAPSTILPVTRPWQDVEVFVEVEVLSRP